MAKRGRSNVIGDQGVKIIDAALPPEWTCEVVKNDYGRDLRIEVFENDRSTGLIMCGQSKAHEHARVVNNTHVRERITAGRLRYLVELSVPSVLFVVDTSSKQIWWMTPQVDATLLNKLAATESDDDEVSVRIPIERTFSIENLPKFMQAIDTALQRISVDKLGTGDLVTFLDSLAGRDDLEATTRVLQDRADTTRLERAYRLIQAGDKVGAGRELGCVVGNEGSQAHLRMIAFVYDESLAVYQALQANDLDENVRLLAMERAADFVRQMRSAPPPYRAFARTNLVIAELHALTIKRFHLSFHFASGSRHVLQQFFIHRTALTNAVYRHINRLFRMLGVCLKISPMFVPLLVQKGLLALSAYWSAARVELDDAASSKIAEIVDLLVDLGTSIAKDGRNWLDLIGIGEAVTLFPLGQNDWNRCMSRATEVFRQVDDVALRDDAIQRVNSRLMQQKEQWEAMAGFPEETYSDVVRNIVHGMGIDVDNGQDEIACAVRQGIKDISFGRVVETCESIHVELLFPDPLGWLVLLPNMGVKEITCTKHGFTDGGEDLDSAFQRFKSAHCAGCQDRCPRAKEFRWTPAWQEAESERLAGAGFIRRSRG